MSKILIGETKNHFDHEYIVFNSLIYKPYDACHRMSSRYIGKDFPNDRKEDFWQRVERKDRDKKRQLSMKNEKLQLVRIAKKRSLKTGRLSDFASCHVNAVYSATGSEEKARCFLRSSFFSFCSFFLVSISFNICFSGLTVSGSSRLNRLK